ncbi:Phosphatidylinositol-4-phosphate 5-kinase family protein, putative isoform 3 [Hibiscus syriacus]|uniref:Phosphatidylinositol-4-phosphate 5-kinase family protein, putative isoform 3 n=1 Tax=Hibiscus syriacus TaxID=106335 RepID=A0A6A3BS50_HIBSY|nr:Phosphatidylinositol-4-phosphate 5-kinase family protein, putative isoform 3 [Hibiscus syriacus]
MMILSYAVVPVTSLTVGFGSEDKDGDYGAYRSDSESRRYAHTEEYSGAINIDEIGRVYGSDKMHPDGDDVDSMLSLLPEDEEDEREAALLDDEDETVARYRLKVKHVVQYGVFAAYHLALETSFLADEGPTLPGLPLKSPINVALPNKPSSIDRSISTIPGFTIPSSGKTMDSQPINKLQKSNEVNSSDSPSSANLQGLVHHACQKVDGVDLKESLRTKTARDGEAVMGGQFISLCQRLLEATDQGGGPGGSNYAGGNMMAANHLGGPELASSKQETCNNNEEGSVCERFLLYRIKYYGSFDKPLGRFLRDHLFDQSFHCRSCEMPSEAHIHCYTHRQGSLMISVKKLSELPLRGEREGKIWMWHRFLRCPRINGFPPATRRVVMSDAAWGLSSDQWVSSWPTFTSSSIGMLGLKPVSSVEKLLEINVSPKPSKALSSSESALGMDRDFNNMEETELSLSSSTNTSYKYDSLESGTVVQRAQSEGKLPNTENLSETLEAAWGVAADVSAAGNLDQEILAIDHVEMELIRTPQSALPTKKLENLEKSISWASIPLPSFSYNKNSSFNPRKLSINECSPVYISSFMELERQSGARLLLPLGANDTVVPVYDDEPTSIITYALVSSEYHSQMSESERPKDAADSAVSHYILIQILQKSETEFTLLLRIAGSVRPVSSGCVPCIGCHTFRLIDVMDYSLLVGVDEAIHMGRAPCNMGEDLGHPRRTGKHAADRDIAPTIQEKVRKSHDRLFSDGAGSMVSSDNRSERVSG